MTVWLKNSVTCSVMHFWSCVTYVNFSDSHLHHCQFHHCTPSQGEYCSRDQPSRLNTHNGIHHPQARRYHADYMHSYIQLPTQEEWHECVLVCKVHGRQQHAGLRMFSSMNTNPLQAIPKYIYNSALWQVQKIWNKICQYFSELVALVHGVSICLLLAVKL